MLKLSPYNDHALEYVVRLLNSTMPLEGVTEASFVRKVLLDPNFDISGTFLATVQGRLVGFALAIRRKQILEDGPDDRDRGWIPLFAVAQEARRQGIGTTLFAAAENWLRHQGCAAVWISPYAPNYWTPGVDEAAYPEAIAFLHARGYDTVSRPLSMQVALDDWQTPDWVQQQAKALWECRISTFHPEWNLVRLNGFLQAEFPGDWQRYGRETMRAIMEGQRPAEELLVAYHREELVGFAQCEGERFGPFGIAAHRRGQGIGAVLLCAMLERQKQRGLHNAWFRWTEDKTANRLYRPAGFHETRRYQILRKSLPDARL